METLKVVLAMLALVLIGFIGGFATHRHLAKERIHNIARMHRPLGFAKQLAKVIRPNEEQKAQIRPIFEVWEIETEASRKSHNQERVARVDTLIGRIKPFLDEEQMKRLDKHFDRFKNRMENDFPPPKLRKLK